MREVGRTEHCQSVSARGLAFRLSTDASEPYNCEKLDRVEGGFKLLAKPQTLFSVNFEDPAEIASLIEGKLYSLKFKNLLIS